MTDGFPVPGEIFEGRYRISGLIGSGGFARVYLAIQEDLGREVAIKVLMPASNSDGSHYSEKLVRRFNQEARLVSRLRDPHTITMFDYGETTGGLLYMVFEYIEGRSLSQAVHEDGALAPERVAIVLEATLSSLHEAHAFGVLHRDIKPGNIMLFDYLGRPDQVKLLDFGIAKSLADNVPGKDITADGALVGTPRYMSPEQIRGQEMSAASDIYSLGLVAFEMLMGYKAIDSNSSVTIIGKQLDSAPFLVPADADVPEGLKTIVNKMMAKDRSERFQTTEEVLKALTDFKAGKSLTISPTSEDHFDLKKTVPMHEIPVLQVDATMSPVTGSKPIENPEVTTAPSKKQVEESLPIAAAPSDDDSKTTKKLALVAIFALALVGGSAAAVLAVGGDDPVEQVETVDPIGGELPPAAETVVEVEDAEPERELAVADLAATDEEPAQTPLTVELLVATRPVAADISVNGKSYGPSPAQIELNESDFPVDVIADIEGKSMTKTLIGPQNSVIMDVSSIVPEKAEPKIAEKKPTPKRPRPKPTKPKPKPVADSEPKKFDSTPGKKEEDSELSLPPLDL